MFLFCMRSCTNKKQSVYMVMCACMFVNKIKIYKTKSCKNTNTCRVHFFYTFFTFAYSHVCIRTYVTIISLAHTYVHTYYKNTVLLLYIAFPWRYANKNLYFSYLCLFLSLSHLLSIFFCVFFLLCFAWVSVHKNFILQITANHKC